MSVTTKRTKAVFSLTCGLVLLTVVGAAVAVHRVTQVLEAAKPATAVLFDHGLTALDLRAPQGWTNTYCGSCHQTEYKQWQQSRHAISASNENFQLECLLPAHGRRQFCVNCHAPRNPGLSAFPPAEPTDLDEAFRSSQPWVSQGVDCLTCHVRDGKVLATTLTEKGQRAHPMRLAPELATSEFCAGCHQFGFKPWDFPDGFNGDLQQASFEEFLDVRAKGQGEARCHDCHLPDGDHRMRGGYSAEMLEQAVWLELAAQWRDDFRNVHISVVVEGGHVGHRIPGGEHFRYLTLKTTLIDATGRPVTASETSSSQADRLMKRLPASQRQKVVRHWPQVETMRRHLPFPVFSSNFSTFTWPHVETKRRRFDKSLSERTSDNRLWPGEQRRFDYLVPIDATPSGPLKVRTELWYHLMDDGKARVVGHELDEVRWLVQHKEMSLVVKDRP